MYSVSSLRNRLIWQICGQGQNTRNSNTTIQRRSFTLFALTFNPILVSTALLLAYALQFSHICLIPYANLLVKVMSYPCNKFHALHKENGHFLGFCMLNRYNCRRQGWISWWFVSSESSEIGYFCGDGTDYIPIDRATLSKP
jgi:hypothetical protein